MTRTWLAAVVCVFILLTLPESACTCSETFRDDEVEIIVFARRRPVLVRAVVTVNGRPLHDLWRDYLEALFTYLDRDGDRLLDEDEFRRGPSPTHLGSQRLAGLYPRLGEASASVAQADRDGDRSITLEECVAYYREGGLGPISIVETQPAAPAAEPPSLALMRMLDDDGDGRLSRAEIYGLRETLDRLDLNEDEFLTVDEVPSEDRAVGHIPQAPAFILCPDAPSTARQLAEYRSSFRGRYGDLPDADALFHHETIVDCAVNLNPPDGPCRVEVQCARGEHVTVPVPAGGGAITIGVSPSPAGLSAGIRHVFMQQFAATRQVNHPGTADGDPLGTRFALLADLPSLADRNEDGELSESELMRCIDLHLSLLSHSVTLTVSSRDADLFMLFDENRDGRVALPEILTAYDRSIPWDSDGDGRLAFGELPRAFDLRFGCAEGSPQPRSSPVPAAPAGAPRWFHLLDRNGDLRVSRREFVGSEADFRRLDRNSDRLIDLVEATSFDGASPTR
ncbi:MAG: hypothetical protein ACKOFT_04275 [Actinomycetota bacterium]